MVGTENQAERKWLKEQLDKFQIVIPRYQMYARVLQKVLDKAIKKHTPLAIVQTRPKSIVSFGEKALLKKHANQYSDPVNQMTDLCGGRIIVPTRAEVMLISGFIESNFDVDWDYSSDVSQRLKPSEFGYRGIHYIVQFRCGTFPTQEIDIEIPEEVYGLKAEIQVRTILEHAWGVFNHDKAYKGAFQVPEKWQRELAGLAATLEGADNSSARIEDGLKRYAASYGAYMTEEKMREEIINLRTILDYDPENTTLAARIGKLAITLGDWPVAVDNLVKYADSGHPAILRDLGIAMCKLHKDKRQNNEYKEGQRYLEAAITADSQDTDAIASYAGTFKDVDEDKARALYRQAFEVDSSDPYPLGNYIECEVCRLKDVSIIISLRTVIDEAIKRCRDQADVGMDLPWAFFNMGKFYLLQGKPYESLASYARAVQLSHADWLIDNSLQSLEKLNIVRTALPGFEWAHRMLLVGLAAKFPETNTGQKATEQVKKLASGGHGLLKGPIVIITGGDYKSTETQVQSHRQDIIEGFRDFHGTVISAGAITGLSGLASELGTKYPKAIKTVGYLPRQLPAGALRDNRYKELHYTDSNDFSPLEPLQIWTDIIASGVPLIQVRVLGINGGDISAAEYRVALALGLHVAVLKGSGSGADKILTDSDWASSKTLICLPDDPMTIGTFLGGARIKLEPEIRDIIGRAIHKKYRAGKKSVSVADDPASAPWEQLPDNLKESSFQQADDISYKLQRIGCKLVKITGPKVVKMTFTKKEIELMAEMEHARWNVERLLDRWRLGKRRDLKNKISPYLVAWDKLPEEVKEWDRQIVRNMPELLAKVGLEIRRM